MNSPSQSVFRDYAGNRKQSSASILTTSNVNRSHDTNVISLNSYNKVNLFNNSFSTSSCVIPAKGLNRSEMIGYNRRRPELEIEELYDKEMESYFSLAKKEDLNETDIDSNVSPIFELKKINLTNNDKNVKTDKQKSRLNNFSTSVILPSKSEIDKQKSRLNTFSTSVILPSKSENEKSKLKPKNTPTPIQTKEIAKKPIGRSASVLVVKKVAPIPTGKKTASNAVAENKKENLAIVDKNKAAVSTEGSAKMKNSTYSTTKKQTNSKTPSISVESEKIEVNKKNIPRTNSIYKTVLPSLQTKAEVPNSKISPIGKKVVRK